MLLQVDPVKLRCALPVLAMPGLVRAHPGGRWWQGAAAQVASTPMLRQWLGASSHELPRVGNLPRVWNDSISTAGQHQQHAARFQRQLERCEAGHGHLWGAAHPKV